jgi:hypothetical protein
MSDDESRILVQEFLVPEWFDKTTQNVPQFWYEILDQWQLACQSWIDTIPMDHAVSNAQSLATKGCTW